jgi:hypothetical protein
MENTVLEDTDFTEKAQAKIILQNDIAMDAMVQCMSKMDDFHRFLLSMKEDVNWPTRKAWKMAMHPESLHTHGHNRFKGLNNGVDSLES